MKHADSRRSWLTMFRIFISAQILNNGVIFQPMKTLLIMLLEAWLLVSFCHPRGSPTFLWDKDMRLLADEVPELTIGNPKSEVVTGYSSCCRHPISENKLSSFNTVTEQEDTEHCIIKDLQIICTMNSWNCWVKAFLYHPIIHCTRLTLSFAKMISSGWEEHCATMLFPVLPIILQLFPKIISHHQERMRHKGKGFTVNEIRSKATGFL